MALICPNCKGDTTQQVIGGGIHCLECGMFTNADGSITASRVDAPEELTGSHSDWTENPQVGQFASSAVTSSVGASFGPSTEALTGTESLSAGAGGKKKGKKA